MKSGLPAARLSTLKTMLGVFLNGRYKLKTSPAFPQKQSVFPGALWKTNPLLQIKITHFKSVLKCLQRQGYNLQLSTSHKQQRFEPFSSVAITQTSLYLYSPQTLYSLSRSGCFFLSFWSQFTEKCPCVHPAESLRCNYEADGPAAVFSTQLLLTMIWSQRGI